MSLEFVVEPAPQFRFGILAVASSVPYRRLFRLVNNTKESSYFTPKKTDRLVALCATVSGGIVFSFAVWWDVGKAE